MVRGPVFAAQVENEWITDAEKKIRHVVRGYLVGLSPFCPTALPEFLGHTGGATVTVDQGVSTH